MNGARRIFAYNWPVFVGTWAVALAGIAWASLGHLPHPALIALGCTVALGWSAVSLVVSAYVYDRSELLGGAWVVAHLPAQVDAWASVHAGLDAEIDLEAVMPGRCVAHLDIFDPRIMTAPSIARARRLTPLTHDVEACSPTALALATGACDAIVVAFTAHEIRDKKAREQFFAELSRTLRPGGRALLVEHVRDLANFLAFGPGYLHFLPRSEWLRLAKHAGFSVHHEACVTPWIMALTLERGAVA